jgi:cyanoexosortase A
MALIIRNPTRSLHFSKYLLLAIAIGLAVIHLSLILRDDDPYTNPQNSSFIASWAAVGYFVWSRRERLPLCSSPSASLIGAALLSVVLFWSASLNHYVHFLKFSPLLSVVGVALLASGWRGLKFYWRELLVLAFPAALSGVSRVIDISLPTADLAANLLLIAGFRTFQEGVVIFYQSGAIVVNPGCSGLVVIWHLLNLVLIYLLMFPTRRMYWILLPIAATFIAFFINGIRVALIALLSTPPDKVAFDYWHEGDGSMIFSMTSVILLGLLCHFWVSSEKEVILQPEQDHDSFS